MKRPLLIILLPLAAAITAAAFADGQSVYKWTDANGTMHYSDKPPEAQPADLTTLDLPALPPQDPAKIAADQATQAANTAATLKLLQAQLALQQQQLAMQLQQAQLEAAQNPPSPPQTDSTDMIPVIYPIYQRSAFMPHAFRRHLYLHHDPIPDRGTPVMRPAPRPAPGHAVAELPSHP